MLKVGLTGGIGSGKTTVGALFEVLGAPVFYADDAARRIMDEDAGVRAALVSRFGETLYIDDVLDRKTLAGHVFNNPGALADLNAIVHPAAIAASLRWMEAQPAAYVIKEAAIFFETGSERTMDLMIGVTAPEATRIGRVIKRSGLTEAEIRVRMVRQMNDAEKMSRCDYVINNGEGDALIPQVLRIDAALRERL
jgi:dephospho-CoA kinase